MRSPGKGWEPGMAGGGVSWEQEEGGKEGHQFVKRHTPYGALCSLFLPVDPPRARVSIALISASPEVPRAVSSPM